MATDKSQSSQFSAVGRQAALTHPDRCAARAPSLHHLPPDPDPLPSLPPARLPLAGARAPFTYRAF